MRRKQRLHLDVLVLRHQVTLCVWTSLAFRRESDMPTPAPQQGAYSQEQPGAGERRARAGRPDRAAARGRSLS
jgi:hypothetical protein